MMYLTLSNFRVPDRLLVWLGLVILVSVWVSAGSVAQQPTPTLAPNEFIASKAEDIVGIWETQFDGATGYYMQYKADGTFRLANSIENLEKYPTARGTIWFEETVYHMKGSLSSVIGKYEVRVQKEGDTPIRLSLRVIKDSNTVRAQDLIAGMSLIESLLPESEEIATKIEDLVGIWKGWFKGSMVYWQFEADGTLTLGYTVEELKSHPILSGTFWFEGEVFKCKDPVADEGSGAPGAYKIWVRKRDGKSVHLSFHVIEDPSDGRPRDLTRGMMRVAP